MGIMVWMLRLCAARPDRVSVRVCAGGGDEEESDGASRNGTRTVSEGPNPVPIEKPRVGLMMTPPCCATGKHESDGHRIF